MGLFDKIRRLFGDANAAQVGRTTGPAPTPAYVPLADRPVDASEPIEYTPPLASSSDAAPAPETALDDEPEAETEASGPDGKERRQKTRRMPRPGTRVLIIDDSATIVALLGRMLKQNNCDILEAGDAETGLAMARSENPELIFLDIVLPGMNGFAALRHLRREAGTKDTPVIMISGNEQATEQFYVQRIGADDFMKKPFSRPEVFARVERLLDDDLIPRRQQTAPAIVPPTR
ncbi:response regulator [Arenimonas sp.]|uniref:response regulator n=1 Tax=Arenimonas sp. TaxID=1872635 RepID=UPI0039E3339C